MKLIITFCLIIINIKTTSAQTAIDCKVELTSIAGEYYGDCKKGFADGKGESKGKHRYIGFFKNGLPNGKGEYYFNDSTYYSGNFQDGIKEGKGEMHYKFSGKADSVLKGYWSADEYRGTKYVTYKFFSTQHFDADVQPSEKTGNTITINLSNRTGAPESPSTSLYGSPGNVLTITELFSPDGDQIIKVRNNTTANRFTAIYQVNKFPVKLTGMLSNGRTFELELYKNARWTINLFAIL